MNTYVVLFQLMLYQITHNASYREDIESFVEDFSEGGVEMTPCGLSFREENAPFRHAGSLICKHIRHVLDDLWYTFIFLIRYDTTRYTTIRYDST